MKKNIYFLFVAMLPFGLIGCSTEDESIPEVDLSEIDLLLNEYNLLDTDVNFENFTLGIDTNLIYFNGRKKDQSFKIRQAYTYKNSHVFILQGGDSNDAFSTLSLDLFFVSNQDYVKVKKIRKAAIIQNLFTIIPWYEGRVLYNTAAVGGESVCISYSVNGEEIYKTEDHIRISEVNIIPINLYEYIGFQNNFFYRNDLTIKNRTWFSESVLPDNSRADEVKITREDSDHVIFDIKYTLYSGDKESKKFKVEIESGTFTEI